MLPTEVTVGVGKFGVHYRATLPRIEKQNEAFSFFYQSIVDTLPLLPPSLSSLVLSGRGEMFTSHIASIRLEITSFVDKKASAYAVKSQVWDLDRGVILRLADIFPDKKKRHKIEHKISGWDLQGGQICLYSYQPPPSLPNRRSAFHALVEQTVLPIDQSPLLSSLLEKEKTLP